VWPETEMYKEETKTYNAMQCSLSAVRVKDPWRQSKWNREDYRRKDL